MKNIKLIAWALLTTAWLLAASCGGGDRMIRSEMDPSFKGKAYSKVLVIALAEHKGAGSAFEQEFAKKFRAEGVSSEIASKVIPPARQKSEKAVLAEARRIGAQAIFLTFLITQNSRDVSQPGWSPSNATIFDFGAYYPGAYRRTRSVSHYQDKKYLHLQTSLYDVATGKRVWGANYEVFELQSAKQVADNLATMVMADLQKNGLIK